MIVDLRSDVFTKPTPEMVRAMNEAVSKLGDDVYGEDPFINALQEKVAKLLGKEAALFVASGTMANQLAIAAQTKPRDEIILDSNSHIFQFEQGAHAVISGVQTRPIPFEDGLPSEKAIENALRFPDIHYPSSRLLCLEVTHALSGGTVPDYGRFKAICIKAHSLGLKIHLDGARIWNAVVASGRGIRDFTGFVDTVMFSFTKGLGAPVGAILAGPAEVIRYANYIRKGIGGGWHKAGILAAAAMYALDNHVERLKEDHARAQRLAEAISANQNLELIGRVDTNIVFFRPKKMDIVSYSDRLTEKGVLHEWRHFKNMIRLVVHNGISDEMIDYAISAMGSIS